MKQPWKRQPGEPSDAYAAFEAVLEQWPQRIFVKAYRKLSGKAKARKMPGNWDEWKKHWRWDERLDAYDLWKQGEEDRAKAEAHNKAYAAKLEEYRKAHENYGKGAFNNASLLTKALQNFALEYVGSPDGSIKPARQIQNAAEAKQLSGVISDFMKFGPQVWADALGIPELKEQLEAMNAATEE